jgi:hypothetical protein
VLLYTRNSAINSIKLALNVTIQSLATIDIDGNPGLRLQGSEQETWEGRYHRLTEDLQNSVIEEPRHVANVADFQLRGLYKSSDGLEILFEEPFYTWMEGSDVSDLTTLSGGYSILAGAPLLNAFYLDRESPDGVHIVTFQANGESNGGYRSYMLEYREEQQENAMVRTILLTPADLLTAGVLLTSKVSFTLEQIEILEEL